MKYALIIAILISAQTCTAAVTGSVSEPRGQMEWMSDRCISAPERVISLLLIIAQIPCCGICISPVLLICCFPPAAALWCFGYLLKIPPTFAKDVEVFMRDLVELPSILMGVLPVNV
jgi:hypothetical protein